METGRLPYETLILVCTNARGEGEKVSCAGAGRCGAVLRDALKAEAAKRGLKGRVRVSASGCLDFCEKGPNILVISGDARTVYHHAAEKDVPALIEKHFPAPGVR